MKKIITFFQAGLIALGLAGAVKTASAQTISSHFFGENAWMPDTIGNSSACTEPPCILNGKLHKQWNAIKNSGAQIIRFGGITPDKNMPTNYQYVRMIDSIRANGMEPVMQVPFKDYRYTALQAADIVHYLNVTKNKNIKYWIIGNEPNLGYSYHTAAQIAAYIRPFATAMKNIDPSIIIIGPEIAWYEAAVINGLTTPGGPDDITGKDAAGHYYIDVISFHTYPFNGSQSRSQVITKLTAAGSLNDNLVALNARIASCNSFHNRTGSAALKTAITEANISYQNDPSDNVSGVGTNSFIGGQFIAEMFGIGMKNSVDFINIWSVIEGSNVSQSLGYISQNGTKKPEYYHFKMMAENFRGQVAGATTNKANVKAFGSKDPQFINVMIMNQEQSGSYNYTVRLNTDAIGTADPLKINVNAGIPTEYNDVITNQATVLLTFNASGILIRKTEYSLSGQALANQPPVTTEYVTTGIGSGTPAVASGKFDMKIFPNPAIGKFTIELNKGNSVEQNFDIEVFNMIGQQIYRSKSEFANNREVVELSPSLAQGAYIVRVKEKNGGNLITKRVIVAK